MNNKEIIMQKRWVYTLYRIDGKLIISVAFTGQQTDYTIEYLIPIQEISDTYLTDLAASIVKNPNLYKKFEY